jgi:membrane protease YdiL (CAAX protease family)
MANASAIRPPASALDNGEVESAATAAPPADRPRLRWLDLVPVLLVTIAGAILIFGIVVALARLSPTAYHANRETIALLATLAIYLAFGAGISLGLRRLRAPLSYIALFRPTARDFGLTLLLILPWYIGVGMVTAVSSALFNGGQLLPSNARRLFVERPQGLGTLVLALLVTAVAAPLCEEVFFRGMLFRLLRRRLPFVLAVIASAIAFGLAHASPAVSPALLPVFAYMGIALALLYSWTGRLTSTVLLHALNNAIGTVTVFLLMTG